MLLGAFKRDRPYFQFRIGDHLFCYDQNAIVKDFLADVTSHFALKFPPALYYDTTGYRVFEYAFLSTLCSRVSSLELSVGGDGYRVHIGLFQPRRAIVFSPTKLLVPIEIKALFGITADILLVNISETVEELKRTLEGRLSIEAEALTLISRGQILENDRPLYTYNIHPYSIIRLRQKLRGGAKHLCPDLRCKCTQHDTITGCCSVCRIACKCAQCTNAEVCALTHIRDSTAVIQSGMQSTHDRDMSNDLKEEVVERYD
jgi:Ubiquitin family